MPTFWKELQLSYFTNLKLLLKAGKNLFCNYIEIQKVISSTNFIISLHSSFCTIFDTVKPVYNSHTWDPKTVVVVHRWVCLSVCLPVCMAGNFGLILILISSPLLSSHSHCDCNCHYDYVITLWSCWLAYWLLVLI